MKDREIDTEFTETMNKWLKSIGKEGNKLVTMACKPGVEAAIKVCKQENFIWDFYNKHNLGTPVWDKDDTRICVIGDCEGNPMLIIESYISISNSIWRTFANFVHNKIENEEDATDKYFKKEHFASVFKKVFKKAPWKYHSLKSVIALDYDGT